MEWILLAVGLVLGGGAGFGFGQLGKKTAPIVIQDLTAEKQQDVVLQLTDLDLVKEACSSEFIVVQKQGSLLCRELFCRMQQRGTDAKTGAMECEGIANISNKTAIYEFCEASTSEIEGGLKACIEFFDRRI